MNICKLCNFNEAKVTGSHFISACVVEWVYGKRNYEEAYQINLSKQEVKTYFGPSNLKNTSIDKSENFIIKDFVFCEECEEIFSKLENECCNNIKTNLNKLNKSGHKINRTKNNNKYFIAEKMNKNVLQHFIYSLIVRAVFNHELKGEKVEISESQLTFLSNELLKDLNYKQLRKIDIGFLGVDFIILTTYNHNDTTKNPILINPSNTNPMQIFLGVISILFFKEILTSENFEEKTFLPLPIIDEELLYTRTQEKIKIGIINETKWDKVVFNFYKKEVDKSFK
jgi:hypothetical protein